MSDMKQRLRARKVISDAYGNAGTTLVNPDGESAIARIEELEAEVLTWRKVAQSATPGGSEYMYPERVKAHISEMRESLHNARCDAVKQRRRIDEIETALRSIAANSCCEDCREAALVAKRALERTRTKP